MGLGKVYLPSRVSFEQDNDHLAHLAHLEFGFEGRFDGLS